MREGTGSMTAGLALIDKCIGALGALELGLAMKMSRVNVEQMVLARKAADPKAAAASFLRSRYYKAWSRAQLNNTEYAPMLCVLMLLIRALFEWPLAWEGEVHFHPLGLVGL